MHATSTGSSTPTPRGGTTLAQTLDAQGATDPLDAARHLAPLLDPARARRARSARALCPHDVTVPRYERRVAACSPCRRPAATARPSRSRARSQPRDETLDRLLARAPDRAPARAAARVARRLRPRGRGAPAGRGDARRPAAITASVARRCCRCPRRATRSRASPTTLNDMLARLHARRSSTSALRRRREPRAADAARAACAPSSSSRCAGRARRRSSRRRSARVPRRPSGSRDSPRTCC